MEHTFQIIDNQTLSRSAAIKMLRKNKFSVSGDFSVTTRAVSDSHIQQMIRDGVLREKDRRRFEKKIRGRKIFQTSSFEIIKRNRDRKRDSAIQEIFESLYRLASSSWAGGENYFSFKGDSHSREAAAGTYRAWSSNGKWSGNSNRFTIAVEPEWMRKIGNRGIACINYELTTHAVEIEPGIWLASWLKQGRGFQISSVTGLIMADGQNFRKMSLDFKKADSVQKAAQSLKKLYPLLSEKLAGYDEKSAYFKIMLATAPELVLMIAAKYEKDFTDQMVGKVLFSNLKRFFLKSASQ